MFILKKGHQPGVYAPLRALFLVVFGNVYLHPTLHPAPNTTKAELANTVDPDEMAHIELSHLDLQCLPSSL